MQNKMIISILGMLLLLGISTFSCSDKLSQPGTDETAIEFSKRFINTVDNKTTGEAYKNFWGERMTNNVLNDPKKLRREIENSAAMHKLLIADNTLATQPEINDWGDDARTTTFMFTLNNPTTLSLPEYPKSGDSPWLGYQITVEKENDKWVVSGESLTR